MVCPPLIVGIAITYVTFCPYIYGCRIRFLARLRVPKRPTFEFAFGLEPIVQLTAWLFAAFEIDFVCATSDVLVTRRVPCRSLSRLRRLGGGRLGPCTSISLWFR